MQAGAPWVLSAVAALSSLGNLRVSRTEQRALLLAYLGAWLQQGSGRYRRVTWASAGALAGSADVVAAVRSMHNVLGGVIDPHAASLLLRGMKTLGLRVDAQNRTALEVCRVCKVF